MTTTKTNIREITFAIYVENGGDGSASARIFPSVEAAEAFVNDETQYSDERFCDGDISNCTILVDEAGNLVAPPKTRIREDGLLIENFTLGKHTYDDPCDWEKR